MTQLQVSRARNLEEARSNLAKERELNRSNTAREREEERKNRAAEDQKKKDRQSNERIADAERERKEKQDKYSRVMGIVDRVGAAADRVSGRMNQKTDQAIGTLASVLGNDWSWYFKDTNELKLHARLPMAVKYGTLDYPAFWTSGMVFTGIPSIAVLETAPTIGFSDATISNDELYKAITSRYRKINKATGRNSNYDPLDLFIYELVTASATALLTTFKRMLAICELDSSDGIQENSALPETLARALGFDYKDFVEHIYEFRGKINRWARDLSGYPRIPDSNYQNRWTMEVIGGYYDEKDTTTKQQQMYFFKPKHFFKWSTSHRGASTAEAVNTPDIYISEREGGKYDYESWMKFGDEIFGSFPMDSDYNLMQADLEQAYDKSVLYSLPGLVYEEKTPLLMIHDDLVLLQFKNALLPAVPYPSMAADNWYIGQDESGSKLESPGPVISGLEEPDTNKHFTRRWLHCNGMTSGEVELVESTRLMPCYSADSSSIKVISHGPTVPVRLTIYVPTNTTRLDVDPASGELRVNFPNDPSTFIQHLPVSISTCHVSSAMTPEQYLFTLLKSNFDYLPSIKVPVNSFALDEDDETYVNIKTYVDVIDANRVGVITDDNLKVLDESIVYHLYNGQ